MHMVFVAFPSVDASSLSEESLDLTEDWYVNEISEMTRHESTKFMKEILLTPDVRRLVPRQESKFHVRIIKPYGTPFTKHEVLTFYEPLTLKNIVSEAREDYVNKFEGKKWDPSLGGYKTCFENNERHIVLVIYDYVLISEYEAKLSRRHIVKKEHLTPLENSFEKSIIAAKQILDEMKYIEKRENRMKVTADNTNSRIKHFSYFSIIVLIGVTWLQITYLKSYFKKKKVL